MGALLEEGFELFGGLAVFGFFFFLLAVGYGGELVGAFGAGIAGELQGSGVGGQGLVTWTGGS